VTSSPPVLTQTIGATTVRADGPTTAVANVFPIIHPRRPPRRRFGHLLRHLPHLLVEAGLQTLGARATAAGAIGTRTLIRAAAAAPPRMPIGGSPTGANGHGQALHDAAPGGPMAGPLAGIHAVVVREVAADHVGVHGRAFFRQGLGLVGDVGAVFAVVHSDFAVVARAGLGGLVERVRPLTAATDTWWEGGGQQRSCPRMTSPGRKGDAL